MCFAKLSGKTEVSSIIRKSLRRVPAKVTKNSRDHPAWTFLNPGSVPRLAGGCGELDGQYVRWLPRPSRASAATEPQLLLCPASAACAGSDVGFADTFESRHRSTRSTWNRWYSGRHFRPCSRRLVFAASLGPSYLISFHFQNLKLY